MRNVIICEYIVCLCFINSEKIIISEYDVCLSFVNSGNALKCEYDIYLYICLFCNGNFLKFYLKNISLLVQLMKV